MSYQLQLWIKCPTEDAASELANLLARASRPCFIEDVPEAQQPLFELIESLEFPEECESIGQHLWLWWHDEVGVNLSVLSPVFAITGGEVIAVFEVPDEPMTGDEDDVELGWFWINEAGRLVKSSRDRVLDIVPAAIGARFLNFQN